MAAIKNLPKQTKYRERLEYKFSNIKAEQSYDGKIHLSNEKKGDMYNKGESNNVKFGIHQTSGDHSIWLKR